MYRLRLLRRPITQIRHISTPPLISQVENSKPKPTVLQTAARATATGSYFVIVSAGVALVGVVLWALGSNLFFETRYLSEAIDLITHDAEVKRLLGNDIKSYGERNGHRRGGPVQSQRTEDGHVFMLFHVEGSTGRSGTCRLDVQESSGGSQIRQLYVDVPGHSRIWLKQPSVLQKRKKLFSW